MEWTRDTFTISDDTKRVDVETVHRLLTLTYWAFDRSLKTVQKSMENSICFGLYEGDRQIGFARVVTDAVTFAWIADIVLDEAYRGRGLGRWLAETVSDHPMVADCVQLLMTKDTHGLYEQLGFKSVEAMRKGKYRNRCD